MIASGRHDAPCLPDYAAPETEAAGLKQKAVREEKTW